MAASKQRVELRPFREQEPFLKRDKKYYGYVSGVGAGKTFAGVLRAALNAEQWNPGEMGAIVAPTTTMIKDVILPVMQNSGLLEHWEYKSAHSDEPGIHVPNGARILLLSADNRRTIERLRGLNLSWWWIDEASDVPKRAVDILTQRLRVGQYRNGFMTTTPKGKNHVYDFFVGNPEGESQSHGAADLFVAPDRLSILRVPTHANPYTPEDYKQSMDQDHEGQFYEQEVLGRFVQFEGLVYPWFDPETHVIDDSPESREIKRVMYGVDWGFSNPSAILAIGETADDRLVVLEEFHESRVTVNDLVRVADDMQARHQPGTFFCDAAEPDSIEEFQRAGLDAVPADKSVQAGISTVTSEQHRLRVTASCQNLINEFGQYRYRDDGDSEDPVSKNDHALDALRYCLHSRQDAGWNIGMDFA